MEHRCGPPQYGLPSNVMDPITSGCGALAEYKRDGACAATLLEWVGRTYPRPTPTPEDKVRTTCGAGTPQPTPPAPAQCCLRVAPLQAVRQGRREEPDGNSSLPLNPNFLIDRLAHGRGKCGLEAAKANLAHPCVRYLFLRKDNKSSLQKEITRCGHHTPRGPASWTAAGT